MHHVLRRMNAVSKQTEADGLVRRVSGRSCGRWRGLLDHPPQQGYASWLIVVILCGLVAVICSIDRTAMSVAVLPMGDKVGLHQHQSATPDSCSSTLFLGTGWEGHLLRLGCEGVTDGMWGREELQEGRNGGQLHWHAILAYTVTVLTANGWTTALPLGFPYPPTSSTAGVTLSRVQSVGAWYTSAVQLQGRLHHCGLHRPLRSLSQQPYIYAPGPDALRCNTSPHVRVWVAVCSPLALTHDDARVPLWPPDIRPCPPGAPPHPPPYSTSAFNLGHTVTNFYGGYLASAYSPKLVLSCGVVFWSTFTILTPPAAVMGLAPLIVVRALMGLGEGVAYPTMQVRGRGRQQVPAPWVN